MIEIDGLYFNTLDHDAESEMEKVVIGIIKQEINHICDIMVSDIPAPMKEWQMNAVAECAKFAVFNITKYPYRWKGCEIVSVNRRNT